MAKSALERNNATPAQKAAIRHYLATGDHDPNLHLWPGQNFMASEINTHAALRGALIDAFKDRAAQVPKLPSVRTGDVSSLTRTKVAPMVGGLFAQSEQAVVMNALERSVVFLTPTTLSPCWNHPAGCIPPGFWPTCTCSALALKRCRQRLR